MEAAVGARFEAGLAEALQARILELDGESVSFTHPLLGTAVTTRQTPASRRSLHARLADIVPSAEERARHLALATSEPDGEVASILDEAARTAHVRGATATAAELAEQALRLTPASDTAGVHRRTLLTAERLMGSGDHAHAIALLEQARTATPPGVQRAALLVELSNAVGPVHGQSQSLQLAQSALDEAQGDATLEATAHLGLANRMRFVESGSVERGLEHAELAIAAAARAENPALTCQALSRFGLIHFLAGRGVPQAEMEEALAVERSLAGSLWEATWTVCHQLAWAGEDPERAREHLHAYRDAMRARVSVEEMHSLHWLSLLEWRAGNWDLAARYADELLSLVAQTGAEGELPVCEMRRCPRRRLPGRARHPRPHGRRAGAREETRQLRLRSALPLAARVPAAVHRRLSGRACASPSRVEHL